MDEKIIAKWLQISSGSGSGSGYGSGFGDGSGSGYGSGSGSGSGFGDGSGSGYGSGSGDGSGYGSGFGYGSGSGSGSGFGDGSGIKYYNKHRAFIIDNIYTIITNIKGNIAKGYILQNDLTLEKTYVAKGNNLFAHGKTIKEALNSLEEKIISNMDLEDRKEEFKKFFNKTDKYKGTEFFKWHSLLTGSCLQGRESFVKNKGLDVEKEYTVKEFLKIVKGAYGWSMLEELEKEY